MNKIEVLETVKKRVEEQGVSQYRYVDASESSNTECFCAVGHVMAVCGVNLDLFKENSFLNRYGIDRMFRSDAPEMTDLEQPILDDYILDPLKEAGFTFMELASIQELNDSLDEDEHRKVAVIEKLDRMIAYEKSCRGLE